MIIFISSSDFRKKIVFRTRKIVLKRILNSIEEQYLKDYQYGFPFLSARGGLVLNEIVILGASIITRSESAVFYFEIENNLKHLNKKSIIAIITILDIPTKRALRQFC